MKRLLGLVTLLSMLICSVAVLSSCELIMPTPDAGEGGEPTKLGAPTLTLVDDKAVWSEVKGAVGYEVSVGLDIITYDATVSSHTLKAGDTALVRAVGDGEKYLTSAWSNSVTYGEKPEEPPKDKLATPVVALEGAVASWAAVEGADGYELSIGMTKLTLDATVTSYTLSDGETIVVRAISNSSDVDSSAWSALVKYTAPVDGGGSGSGDSTGGDGGDTPDDPIGPVCTAHTDANSDERCDTCGISVVVIIDFYAINDLHGKFCDTDTQPGVDELSTYLKQREDIDDNVIVLSSGDMWQGSGESNLTYGQLMTEWMNIVGVVSMTLGNHEYDWGEEYIRQNLEIADFPFLAINIYDTSTGELADYCTPSVMIEEGGIQVGIIGAIGDCYSSILAEMVSGVEFKVGSALTALVKDEADRLRALGADIIVYSLHDGEGGYNSSLSNGYVDLVFEGHTHSAYTSVDPYGVYHVQAGGENRGISHAEVKLSIIDGEVSVTDAGVIYSSAYSSLPDDAETEALEDKYQDVIDMATSPLGKVSAPLSDNEVESLVARLYCEAGVAKWGSEYDIVLGGGFLRTRSPYDLSSGTVTYGDLMSLLPFNNQLVLCSISGHDLLNKFINSSSADYHIYPSVSASTIDTSATYYVVVDTYTSSYAPNRLTEIERYDESTYARDLLANYIKDGNLEVDYSDVTLTSIADALSIGAMLSIGETTTEVYYVKGTITSIDSTTYGNLYLTDGAGNTIFVYGLYDEDGNRYDKMATKPAVGDEITVAARIKCYNSYGTPIIELISATWIG